MKKRIESVQLKKGGKATKCTLLVVLTGSELDKFTSESLKKRIDAAAKDFHLDWDIEDHGNIKIALISRTFEGVFGDDEIHQLEIAASNFMTAVEHMDVTTKDPEDQPTSSQSNISEDDINFVEALLEDWDGQDSDAPIVGFMPIMAPSEYSRVMIGGFTIPNRVAKEMCQLFIKAHKHG